MSQLAAGSIEDLKVSKETTKESSCIKHGGALVAKLCPTFSTPCTVATKQKSHREDFYVYLRIPGMMDTL